MSTSSIVPECPRGVSGGTMSIRREDFLQENFSVDSFLTRWNATHHHTQGNDPSKSLETLRDELGLYLKVLRSAMIELINEDYADFVNLSTNLVGLDNGIKKVEEPLIR